MDRDRSIGPLRWTFIGLIGLLIATMAAHFICSGPVGLVVAIVIAAIKAGLVAVIFMDLRNTGTTSRIIAAGSLVWLSIIVILVMADYLTRGYEDVSTHQFRESQQTTAFDQVKPKR